jgi:VWFA-related protein
MLERLARTRARRFASTASLVAVAATAAVVATAIVAARQAPAQIQPRPTFRTEANYIRVDVYATMRDGTLVEDLRRDEFRLFEDRAPQTIDQFSPVVIRSGGTATRSDPSTPEASLQAAADARARVFVLFLDVMHVDGIASQKIARPLIDALRTIIGPDDLVAIVSQQIRASTIVFTRQMATVENALNRAWGVRDRVDITDPVEQRYASCYPGVPRRAGELVAPDLGIAQEMILRRREEQAFDALGELVTYLRDVREERKAIITITNGWRLYTPNDVLTRMIEGVAPTAPGAGFDPRSGRLSTSPDPQSTSSAPCDADRLRLAQLDHPRRFREILDKANRANVSFYPVDPRGIVAFDDDIVPVAGVGQNPTISPVEDNRRLGERHTSLRTMAESTDGVAVLDTNNFGPALKRMTSDLSSYYLLGYYSTGKLDGQFHAITVNVTRPGVQVRARRGYLAATTVAPESLDASGGGAAAANAQAVTAALATLGGVAREPSLYVQAAVASRIANAPSLFVVLEAARGAASAGWVRGADADVLLIDPAGNTVASAHATIPAGVGGTRVTLVPRSIGSGTYEVRVRAKAAGATGASNESARVTVPDSDQGTGAMFFRRGPTTANKEIPTADLRFRRGDTLRVAVPARSSAVADGARLLDRSGKALAVPVAVSALDEADGSRWLSAQAALAPLAPGDYLIEVTASSGGAQQRTLTAFRVVP